MTELPCPWCHSMHRIGTAKGLLCEKCGHRADCPPDECDCAKCRPPTDGTGTRVMIGSKVEFVPPYQGFTGGTVTGLIGGLSRPIATVEVEPGHVVDAICQRLRVLG